MAFTNSWDEDRPQGSQEANVLDNYQRKHRVDLGDRLEDMFYGFNASSNLLKEGDYGVKQLRFKEQSAAPNLGTDEIRVYAKLVGTQAELFFKDEAGNEKQLTSGGKINVLDADGAVMKSGNQTVAGQKTFSEVTSLAKASLLASTDAPTTDAMIANKKYIDDLIATEVTARSFGAYTNEDDDDTAMAAAHAYLANQDGIVIVVLTETGAAPDVVGYVDTDDNPASGGTVMGRYKVQTYTQSGDISQFTFPVASGEYFEITATGATVAIYWRAIGTLVKCTDQEA